MMPVWGELMKVVIMAGGTGTRFWPRSTTERPKQFLSLTTESETMLQQTYRRFCSFLPKEAIYLVTSRNYLLHVLEQLPRLNLENIIIEPEQKDTGPCVALTARFFLDRGIDDVIVTAPSDQYIPYTSKLMDVLNQAEKAAKTDKAVVTLGIVPNRPETGYGYIMADPCNTDFGPEIRLVNHFIEKPPLEKAQLLYRKPHAYWNSGICVWKPSTIAAHLAEHQPLLHEVIVADQEHLMQTYKSMPNISADYAILEKIKEIYTIPIDFIWDDIGTWSSLERLFERDSSNNIIQSKTVLHVEETENCIVYAEHKKAIILGAKNLIIVDTPDGLLVCHKSLEGKIKDLINKS